MPERAGSRERHEAAFDRRPPSNEPIAKQVMDAFLNDLKHTARMLVRAPSFTMAAIAALALGIAVNTAVFSVINVVLLKPLPYHDPERIVMFQNTFRQGLRSGSAAPVEFNWWRQQTEAFENISAYAFTVANLTGESFPEQIPTMQVSADFFRLCGSNALHGRTFTAGDDSPDAPKTVVLAYFFWQRRFGGDTGAIGRRMTLNGASHEIIGVLAPDLENGQISEQALISGDIEISEPPGREASGGLPVARARTMEEVVWRSTAAGDFNALVLTIFGCSALLLAAIGIYGLMAYTVTQRTQKLGIRMALGAESSHIRTMAVRHGLRLALAGVGCGLVMAFGLTRVIAGFLFGVQPWDPRVFLVVPAILVGVALIAVWWPAIRAGRVDPMDALRCD